MTTRAQRASDAYDVLVSVTDSGSGAASDNESLTVNNLNPTVSGVTFTWNAVTHEAKVAGNYADVGTQDTHKATFAWTVTGGSGSVTHSNVVITGGAFSDTIILGSAACYTISVTVTVKDDDTGSVANTPASGFAADAYSVTFLAPIKDGERNVAKWGNVVPVKVELGKMCGAGGTDTTRTLYLSYVAGIQGETIDGDEVVATSVSNADTGNQMRVSGNSYIYNFTTKPLGPSKDYTLLVRLDDPTGPIIQRAILSAKK